jgi:hypothetical protein
LPIIRLIYEATRPLLLEQIEVEISSNRDAIKERIAGQCGDGFFLTITQDDFDLWASQHMSFEEWPEIGQPLLSPELDMDFVPLNFQKVQGTASDDQPDDPLAIVQRQLGQPLGGTSQDRFISVLKGPMNGVEDGP